VVRQQDAVVAVAPDGVVVDQARVIVEGEILALGIGAGIADGRGHRFLESEAHVAVERAQGVARHVDARERQVVVRQQHAPADLGRRIGQEAGRGAEHRLAPGQEHELVIPQARPALPVEQPQRRRLHPVRIQLVNRGHHARNPQRDRAAGGMAAAGAPALVHALVEHEHGARLQVDLVGDIQANHALDVDANGLRLGQPPIDDAHLLGPAIVIGQVRPDADQRLEVRAALRHQREAHRLGLVMDHDPVDPTLDRAQVLADQPFGQGRRARGLLFQAAPVRPLRRAQADAGLNVDIARGLVVQALRHADLGHRGRIQRHQRADRRRQDRPGDDGQQRAPLRDQARHGQMKRETDRCPSQFAPAISQPLGPTR